MDMAKRLSRAFGTTMEHWLRLQMQYDLWNSKHKLRNSDYKKIPILINEAIKTHAS